MQGQSSLQATGRTPRKGLTIPVIGPIPGADPLILGNDVCLNPPTPLQWRALQESVRNHCEHLESDVHSVAAIDAAPLVAFVDSLTGSRAERGQYATLAAIRGIQRKTVSIDMSDNSSFMASLHDSGKLDGSVKLVGVGRATLKDFFYKLERLENEPGEGNARTPILMAEFELLSDSTKSSTASLSNLGNKGARSVECAPVFFVNNLNTLANTVSHLHNERRRLAGWLMAAKLKLEQANIFEDSDGIGMVEKQTNDWQSTSLQSSLASRPNTMNDVVRLENYGVNYFSAFSTIPDLTDAALLDVFHDFYSPQRRTTEEHRFEMLSFIAFRSLAGFCTAEDIGWALMSTNTVERLQRAHTLMMEHVDVLRRLADQAKQDLERNRVDFPSL